MNIEQFLKENNKSSEQKNKFSQKNTLFKV